MITARTTIVVGAGASVDYRMPTGGQLAQTIIRDCQRLSSHDGVPMLRRALIQSEIQYAEAIAFGDRLERSKFETVDMLLEKEPDNPRFQLIGRILIARAMLEVFLPRINMAGQPDGERAKLGARDWLTYLVNRAGAGARRPSDYERLTFITFNFDTIIEDALAPAIAAQIGVSTPEARKLTERMVIHVHGKIRRPEEEVPAQLEDILEAAAQIGIVHDAIPKPRLREIADRLHESEVVAFLGFGFHPDNLAKLEFPVRFRRHRKGHVTTIARSPILASGFDVLDGERKNVERAFGGHWQIEMGGIMIDCLDFLRIFDVLRDDPTERQAMRARVNPPEPTGEAATDVVA